MDKICKVWVDDIGIKGRTPQEMLENFLTIRRLPIERGEFCGRAQVQQLYSVCDVVREAVFERQQGQSAGGH